MLYANNITLYLAYYARWWFPPKKNQFFKPYFRKLNCFYLTGIRFIELKGTQNNQSVVLKRAIMFHLIFLSIFEEKKYKVWFSNINLKLDSKLKFFNWYFSKWNNIFRRSSEITIVGFFMSSDVMFFHKLSSFSTLQKMELSFDEVSVVKSVKSKVVWIMFIFRSEVTSF